MKREVTGSGGGHPATRRGGHLLAALLEGAWRRDPPVLALDEDDLARAAPLLSKSGAAALVWWRLRKSRLRDSEAARGLRQAYRRQTLAAAIQEQEVAEAFSLLRGAGVEPILLKGWSAARLYPEPGLRPAGDIDLLVPPAQLRRAAEALKAWGGRSLVDIDHAEFNEAGRDLWDELLRRTRSVAACGTQVRVLGPEDQLRELCLHFLRHGAYRPVWLCDVAAALESRRAEFDWRACLGWDEVRAGWVVGALALARDLLGAEAEGTPGGSEYSLPRWLTRAVLREWENPDPAAKPPLRYGAPLLSALRHPRTLPAALSARWPNPVEATVALGGRFGRAPRIFYQLGNAAARTFNLALTFRRARR